MGWLSKIVKPVLRPFTDVLGQLTGTKAMEQAAVNQADAIRQQTDAQVRQAQEQAQFIKQQQEQTLAMQRAADTTRALEQQSVAAAAKALEQQGAGTTPEVSLGADATAGVEPRARRRASFMSGRSQGAGIRL